MDTFRLLAALAVVFLHVKYPNLPKEFAIGLRLMSRWAIPFFFIISGYFLAAGAKRSGRLNVQAAVERLIWIFLLWSFIYAVVTIYQDDLGTTIKRIITPYFIYFGTFTHLWFIPSLLFGYLMVAFCYNLNLRWLQTLLSVLAVIGTLLSASYAIFDLGIALDLTAAAIWLSIPFLSIGFLLHKTGPPAWWVSVLLIVFGAALQIVEARFLYNRFGSSPYEHEFLIGTIPFGIGMAGLALSDLKSLQYPLLSDWGRDYSLGIYLIHPLLVVVLPLFISPFLPALPSNPIWQLLFPWLILAMSIFVLRLLRTYFPSGFKLLLGLRSRPPQ